MREKVTYIAFDGKEFDTEMECREHEESRRDPIKIHRAIDTIKNYCRKRDCFECSFFSPLKSCKFMEKIPQQWED